MTQLLGLVVHVYVCFPLKELPAVFSTDMSILVVRGSLHLFFFSVRFFLWMSKEKKEHGVYTSRKKFRNNKQNQ